MKKLNIRKKLANLSSKLKAKKKRRYQKRRIAATLVLVISNLLGSPKFASSSDFRNQFPEIDNITNSKIERIIEKKIQRQDHLMSENDVSDKKEQNLELDLDDEWNDLPQTGEDKNYLRGSRLGSRDLLSFKSFNSRPRLPISKPYLITNFDEPNSFDRYSRLKKGIYSSMSPRPISDLDFSFKKRNFGYNRYSLINDFRTRSIDLDYNARDKKIKDIFLDIIAVRTAELVNERLETAIGHIDDLVSLPIKIDNVVERMIYKCAGQIINSDEFKEQLDAIEQIKLKDSLIAKAPIVNSSLIRDISSKSTVTDLREPMRFSAEVDYILRQFDINAAQVRRKWYYYIGYDLPAPNCLPSTITDPEELSVTQKQYYAKLITTDEINLMRRAIKQFCLNPNTRVLDKSTLGQRYNEVNSTTKIIDGILFINEERRQFVFFKKTNLERYVYHAGWRCRNNLEGNIAWNDIITYKNIN